MEFDQPVKHVVVEARDHGNFCDPTGYLDLLPAFAEDLPAGARAFATDPGHYDFFGQRCVKDLQPDAVSQGETAGEPWLELRFRHNCWKHEEDLTIRYSGVRDVFPASACHLPTWDGRNSVTLDEILPHDQGCSHEIRFLDGFLTVVSKDLTATWTEADCPDKPRSGQGS
jgi:hypothetical protein